MMRKAVKVFPKTDYTHDSAVRHARRGWIKAVLYLRSVGKFKIEEKGVHNKEKSAFEYKN